MNYNEAIEYIHSVTWKGSRPGLERITELLSMMGDPQNELEFVHVAGTNGKGSTSAMTESILRYSGYKTGMFVSPYIESFNERIQIAGKEIEDSFLAEVTEYVKQFADRMEDKPTEFELITAIGFEAFKRRNCDIVVLEVGMGGRLDSTNVIKAPIVCAITSIALDHTAILGDTVEKIAFEKAGIIKNPSPVVWGGDCAPAGEVIKKIAEERNCRFVSADESKAVSLSPEGLCFDVGRYKDLKVPLAGLYQLRNASTVISIIEEMRACGYKISDEAIYKGLEKVKWAGRFEKLSDSPLIYYDGGHNIEGVTYASRTVSEYFYKNSVKVNLVFGVMADKAWRDMVKIISPYVSKAYCVLPDNPRALDRESLKNEFEKAGVESHICESFEEAIRESSSGKVTLALGSLYMYAQVKEAVKKVFNK